MIVGRFRKKKKTQRVGIEPCRREKDPRRVQHVTRVRTRSIRYYT